MKKKLLVAAVAAALAAPGLALAQSSVTISGIFKASLENYRIGSPSAGRTGLNTSENRLADDSSRIVFNVVEDLGGGLQAIGQADVRIGMGTGAIAANGNTHVGVRSKSLGRVFVGRQDVHYGNTESNLTSLAGDLRADSISLMAYMRDGTTAIANATRTPNIIHYTTPNFSGFTAIVAYSMGPNGATQGTAAAASGFSSGTSVTNGSGVGQGDLISAVRKGRAFHINPNYEAANFQVGYSHWNAKNDGGGAALATGDQRSDKLYGSFKMAGFKVGLAWDKSRVKSSVTGTELGNRTVWSIPVGYTMGNNQFHLHYTKARDDRATPGVQDGAKMFAASYQYTLSKRTSVGLTYAKITNDVGASYNFFTVNSLGNSAGSLTVAGEDPRLFAGTIRHAF